jgi:hypothetical protein
MSIREGTPEDDPSKKNEKSMNQGILPGKPEPDMLTWLAIPFVPN